MMRQSKLSLVITGRKIKIIRFMINGMRYLHVCIEDVQAKLSMINGMRYLDTPISAFICH